MPMLSNNVTIDQDLQNHLEQVIVAHKAKARESNTAGATRRNRTGGRANHHLNDALVRKDYNDIAESFENMQEGRF